MEAAQLSFDDYAESKARRDAAMASVAAHAEDDIPGWTAAAEAWVVVYATKHQKFISEQCSDAGYACGAMKEPKNPNLKKAFGPLLKRMAKRGVISQVGHGKSPKRNMSPTPLWSSNVYGRAA